MTDALLKCTTRHIRIFTAICENDNLIEDGNHLTMDIDPDNEFLWEEKSIKKLQERFSELVKNQTGKELSDYTLRKIGSELEGYIRKMLQAGELSYNPDLSLIHI